MRGYLLHQEKNGREIQMMLHLKKILIFSLVLILFGLLTGCGISDQTIRNPERFRFQSNSNDGLVAFSNVCNIAKGALTLSTSKFTLKNKKVLLDKMIYTVSTACQSADTTRQVSMVYMELPPGKYVTRSIEIAADNGALIFPHKIHPIIFEVYPRTITYIGRVSFLFGYSEELMLQISDHFLEDLNKIKETIPNYKKLPIKKKIAILLY